MSQFEGSKLKARCTDCTKLSGNHCTAKNTTVTPKKRRRCTAYEFKGEYENRVPAAALYMPHVDKKTQRLIRKLLRMGVVPVAEAGSVEVQDGFARTKTLTMPTSTATAALIETKVEEDLSIHPPFDPTSVAPEGVFNSTEEQPDEQENNRG